MQKRNWKQIVNDDSSPRNAAPYAASMNPKGTIFISHRTWENLEEPKAVEIFYDPANSCIGVKPASPIIRGVFHVGRQIAGPRSAHSIYAFRLIATCGLSLPETIRFVHPEVDADGLLVLDLRTAVISKGAVNHWRRKKKGDDPAA